MGEMDYKLISWSEIGVGEFFMQQDGRANLHRWKKTSETTAERVHDRLTTAYLEPECGNYWSLPNPASNNEIWEEYIHDNRFYWQLDDLTKFTMTPKHLIDHPKLSMSFVAFILEQFDLYDELIRKKIETVYNNKAIECRPLNEKQSHNNVVKHDVNTNPLSISYAPHDTNLYLWTSPDKRYDNQIYRYKDGMVFHFRMFDEKWVVARKETRKSSKLLFTITPTTSK